MLRRLRIENLVLIREAELVLADLASLESGLEKARKKAHIERQIAQNEEAGRKLL